jgi:hypothetical protein
MCTLCQSLSVQQQIDFHANGDTFAEFFESTDAAANSGTIYSLGLADILYGSLTASTDTADWVAVSIPAGATYFFYGVDVYGVRRRMIWNSRADLVADGLGSSGLCYAA